VFYDATNWRSPTRPSTVDRATAMGAVGRFSFVLGIPDVASDMTVSETYGLVQEGVTWFGPADTAVRCAVRVHPRVRDAGVTDVGRPDVGVADAGVRDAGATDLGIDDVATTDVGNETDVGEEVDSGVNDAGPVEEEYVLEGGDGGNADPMGGVDGGCQCHTGAGARPKGGAVAMLLGALVLAWRRRRR
jgi:MYXO-CTERM domain-containing protein